ncbi:hypothetical protein F0L68_05985 [Solihabitans fulvus]|uniref:Uncharacterized protein n=1 Tax=Solihabitans fulvus TaxID=1892852 RepID=A0A5B2XNV7_9PSEU|nr:hypothetical protein [Solihabitans fulvus]KAA2264644.1 hypothetical protein F0L68_05985 [Solihabitans fulvus]
MQRPSTGRRHTRAGAITVAELIRQQPSPVRIPSSDEAATDGLVHDLLGPPGPDEARAARPNRTAKLVGLVTGAVVLCASVAAASVVAGNHRIDNEPGSGPAPVEITGGSALRPDMLSAQLGRGQDSSPLAVPAPASPPDATRNAPPQAAQPSPSAEQPSSPVSTPPVRVTSGSPTTVAAIKHFYELLRTAPAEAFALVDPGLLGTDPTEFVQSWHAVKAITLDRVDPRPDGSVLAAVSMLGPDDHWLRVEQLFWLTKDTPPRIANSEILSAQRN